MEPSTVLAEKRLENYVWGYNTRDNNEIGEQGKPFQKNR